MKRTTYLVVALTLACIATPLAQRKLVDVVKEAPPGPIYITKNANLPPFSIQDLIKECDVIVRATVFDRNAYLSPDATDVYTDLTLGNVMFIKPREAEVGPEFGIPPTLTVIQLGGVATVDKREVHSIHRNLRPLEIGTEAYFFLARSDTKYFLARRYLGVLGIADNKIVPLAKSGTFGMEHEGKDANQFAQEIWGDIP